MIAVPLAASSARQCCLSRHPTAHLLVELHHRLGRAAGERRAHRRGGVGRRDGEKGKHRYVGSGVHLVRSWFLLHRRCRSSRETETVCV